VKICLVACNAALAVELREALEHLGLSGYTWWEQVYGKGRASGPHFGDHIWPETNHALLVAVEEAELPGLLEAVRALRARFHREGLKAFVWTVDEVR
jgi:hypothetical protein